MNLNLGYWSVCLFHIIMPRRRRSNISQQTRNAIRLRNIANQSTEEERENAREKRRVSMGWLRAFQTEEQREEARETALLAMRNRRALRRDQERRNFRRDASSVGFNLAAFLYDCTINYSSHRFVRIGEMDFVCKHCGALTFDGETSGLCCLNGKEIVLNIRITTCASRTAASFCVVHNFVAWRIYDGWYLGECM